MQLPEGRSPRSMNIHKFVLLLTLLKSPQLYVWGQNCLYAIFVPNASSDSWEQKVFRKYKQLVIIEDKIMCQERLQELRID